MTKVSGRATGRCFCYGKVVLEAGSGSVLAKPIELMHPFVHNGHDTDSAVGEQAPIDIVMLKSGVEFIYPELGKYSAPSRVSQSDIGKTLKQAANIANGLLIAPGISRVDINFVEASTRPIEDPKGGHASGAGVATDDRIGVKNLIGTFRRRECRGQFGFKAFEMFGFNAFLVAADQIADKLADIFIGTLRADIGRRESPESCTDPDIQCHYVGNA